MTEQVLFERIAPLVWFVGELHAFVRVAEVFDFHLLELAGAEGEIARVDFVPEGLADLGDTEGDLQP